MIKKTLLIIALFFAYTNFSFADTNAENEEIRFKFLKPSDPIFIHLNYLQESNYFPAKSAEAFDINMTSSTDVENIAVMLKEIFEAKDLSVRIDEISNSPNYTDSISGQHKYILFNSMPEIYVERVNNVWKYSKFTVDKIPLIHKEIFPFKLSKVINQLTGFTSIKILGIYLWQIVFIFIYVLFAYILFKLVHLILRYILQKAISHSRLKSIISKYIIPITKPLSWIIIVFLIIAFLPLIELQEEFNSFITKILHAFIPAFATVIAYKLCDLIADFLAKLSEKTKSKVDDNLVPLARKIMKILVVIFGLIYILQAFDISVTPLLAGVSIGGLAFALAAQDTIKNLFGSLTIFTDQPFNIGDWIIFDGVEGTVMEVGTRSTRVRTFYDSVITVPNGKLSDLKVDNMGQRNYRRYNTKIRLTYDTTPDTIERFVNGLRNITDMHPQTRKDYYEIHLNGLGEKSIEVLFYIFFEVSNWTEELSARHDVILEILKLAEKLDIRLAYPIRDYSKTVQI